MPRIPSISRAEAAKRRAKLAPAVKEAVPVAAKPEVAKKSVKKKPLRKR
jgi:hypothetical protein